MASKVTQTAWHPVPLRKKTTIGCGVRSRPKNKQKRLNWKKYKGQGR